MASNGRRGPCSGRRPSQYGLSCVCHLHVVCLGQRRMLEPIPLHDLRLCDRGGGRERRGGGGGSFLRFPLVGRVHFSMEEIIVVSESVPDELNESA